MPTIGLPWTKFFGPSESSTTGRGLGTVVMEGEDKAPNPELAIARLFTSFTRAVYV
jgi:hypothetical protein